MKKIKIKIIWYFKKIKKKVNIIIKDDRYYEYYKSIKWSLD